MSNHLDKKNNPIMVDVGSKNITQRIAEAEGEIIEEPENRNEVTEPTDTRP